MSADEYVWTTIGDDESRDTPVIDCHNAEGKHITLVFETWEQLRELTNTLRGLLNAHNRETKR